MVLSCIVMASCSDDKEDPTQTLVNEIQGNWISMYKRHYNNMDDYLNNAKPTYEEHLTEESEFRNGCMIENDQLILGYVKDHTLFLTEIVKFTSNDGTQIKTEPKLGGDGYKQFTLKHLKNDTLMTLRTNTMNPMVWAEFYVRTDLPIIKKY